MSNFAEKKLTPIFWGEIESMIAKTSLTLGPIGKSFFILQLKWFIFFPLIDHVKSLSVTFKTVLVAVDICPKPHRLSVKHVLGVLE